MFEEKSGCAVSAYCNSTSPEPRHSHPLYVGCLHMLLPKDFEYLEQLSAGRHHLLEKWNLFPISFEHINMSERNI